MLLINWKVLLIILLAFGAGANSCDLQEALLILEANANQGEPIVLLLPDELSDEVSYEVAEEFLGPKHPTTIIDGGGNSGFDLTNIVALALKQQQNVLVLDVKPAMMEFDQLTEFFENEENRVWLALPEDYVNITSALPLFFDSRLLFFGCKSNRVRIAERFAILDGTKVKNDLITLATTNKNDWEELNLNKMVERRGIYMRNQTLKALFFIKLSPEGTAPSKYPDALVYAPSLVIAECLWILRDTFGFKMAEQSILDVQGISLENISVTKTEDYFLTSDNHVMGEALLYTSKRREKFDFSESVVRVDLCILTLVQGHDNLNWARGYISAFSEDLWLVLLLTLTAISFCLALIELLALHLNNNNCIGTNYLKKMVQCSMKWLKNLLLLLLQRDVDIGLTQSLGQTMSVGLVSKKLLVMIASMLCYLFFSLYNSSLTSLLTVPHVVNHPFTSLEALADTKYELKMGGAGIYEMLMDARIGNVQRQVAQRFDSKKGDNFVANASEIRHFLATIPNSAWLGTTELLESQAGSYEGLLKFVPKDVSCSAMRLGMPIKKGTHLKSFLSEGIEKLREVGILQYLKSKWLYKVDEKTKSSRPEKSLHFYNTFLPFAILMAGMTLSLLALLTEILVHKLLEKREKRFGQRKKRNALFVRRF